MLNNNRWGWRGRTVVVAALCVSAIAVSNGATIVRTPAHPDETHPLFNGKDLTNFYTWLVGQRYEDPDKVFTVVDAIDGGPAIRVSGQHLGAFITKEEYSNYHLVAEWRWGPATWGGRKDRSKDSGILVHGQGPDGCTARDLNGPWMTSIESQIIQGGTGDFILVGGYDKDGNLVKPMLTVTASKDRDGEDIYDPKAPPREFNGGRINWFARDVDWADKLGFRGREDIESPDGQWTRHEVICDGDKITAIVNGKVVNAGTKSSFTRGKIIFQSEGAEIYFRKIELIPLKK
jgi:hypothetical protein